MPQYAAAAATVAALNSSPNGSLFNAAAQYQGFSLATLAALHQDRLLSKNSSIADLRLKAKKHAEAVEIAAREKEKT